MFTHASRCDCYLPSTRIWPRILFLTRRFDVAENLKTSTRECVACFSAEKGGLNKWRRGQDSNLHILSDGGFQDRCTTNYATPPLPAEIYRTDSRKRKAEVRSRKQEAEGGRQKAKGGRRKAEGGSDEGPKYKVQSTKYKALMTHYS